MQEEFSHNIFLTKLENRLEMYTLACIYFKYILQSTGSGFWEAYMFETVNIWNISDDKYKMNIVYNILLCTWQIYNSYLEFTINKY